MMPERLRHDALRERVARALMYDGAGTDAVMAALDPLLDAADRLAGAARAMRAAHQSRCGKWRRRLDDDGVPVCDCDARELGDALDAWREASR